MVSVTNSALTCLSESLNNSGAGPWDCMDSADGDCTEGPEAGIAAAKAERGGVFCVGIFSFTMDGFLLLL